MDFRYDNANTLPRKFWDSFVKNLLKEGVKQELMRWYTLRAEQYMHSLAHKELALHEPEDVTRYIKMLFDQGRLSDWQLVQAVDAIRNLYLTYDAAWLEEVDWGYLRNSARALIQDHATIARERPAAPNKNERRTASLKQVRRDHSKIITATTE